VTIYDAIDEQFNKTEAVSFAFQVVLNVMLLFSHACYAFLGVSLFDIHFHFIHILVNFAMDIISKNRVFNARDVWRIRPL